MDEVNRTVWCGNLCDKVTEDLLYELFLQGGPVQKVSIPKDRDGKQRSFGFITYKHINSVCYALRLFEGTMLFNRVLFLSTRTSNNLEAQQTEKQFSDEYHNLSEMVQLGRQMIFGNIPSDIRIDTLGLNALPNTVTYPSQINTHPHSDDRRSRRMHPYHRDHNERENTNHRKDYHSHRNKHHSSHASSHSRHSNYKQSRWSYR